MIVSSDQRQSLYTLQKMTNRNAELPRNLRFQENSLRSFVHGSSFLNATGPVYKENLASDNKIHDNKNMLKTHSHFQNRTAGYDYYNKNNLLLKACNAEDIQYIHKNPVIYQEDIFVPRQPKTTKSIPNEMAIVQEKSKTTSNFYNPTSQEKQQGKMSKEAELNNFLFNYKKQQEEKKKKKLKFLGDVEKIINNLENQTQQLQKEKEKQSKQLNDILKIHSEATQNAKKANFVGKINMALNQFDESPKQRISPPKKITEDMPYLQINMLIQEQQEYNDALLEEIQRVSRSKSKNRLKKNNESESEWSPKKSANDTKDRIQQQSSLSKTLKRPAQIPPKPSNTKKMVTTWKGK